MRREGEKITRGEDMPTILPPDTPPLGDTLIDKARAADNRIACDRLLERLRQFHSA